MPLFSVIIPTYNRPQYLREALASVLAQTVADLEVIVVNDGGQAVDPHPDPRIAVIDRSENGGPAAALNTGLAAARGRYVTFLNDDDVFTPRRLEIALEGLADAPIALCSSCGLGDVGRRPKPCRFLNGWVHDTVIDAGQPGVTTVALERAIAPKFNEEYLACEDIEWWLRLSTLAPVATVPEVGYLIREHEGSRGLSDSTARLVFNQRLLDDYADYFRTHRRARAFRYKRIGLRELSAGDRKSARRAFLASFRASPSLRSAWHLARASVPFARTAR